VLTRGLWFFCAWLLLFPLAAQAQSDFPSRPVHVLVGFGPGSAADITARVLAQRLGKTLGQSIVVEIRPGAGSTVAAEAVARAPKDGYTLFVGSVAVIINGLLQQNQRVDLGKDFAPIALTTSAANILVVKPTLGVSNVKELIALAKAKPGQLNFGTSGFGTSPHLTGELFNIMAGTKIVSVHYPGSAQALTDLLGGRIEVMFSPASTVLSHVESGELRALATSEATHYYAAPKIPTVAESGLPGFDTSVWFGLVAPAGTPQPIVDKLAAATIEALHDDATVKAFRTAGLDVRPMPPKEFAAYIASETKKYRDVVAAGGLSQEGKK
jgi:tripartite-type tricarboxylate transporter receptor subunit TctC